MRRKEDHTYTLTLTVRNRPGVLVRCAQVFGRRGHNIEGLHVTAKPERKDTSAMTISAFGNPNVVQQIIAQLAKLTDVLNVEEKES